MSLLREQYRILGIGELLWDQLPEGEKLGGAPASFAVMAARLGNHASILSRVGRDDAGRRAIAALEPLPADQSLVQIDHEHPTGQVTVRIEKDQPVYTIPHPAAWDFMELTDLWVQMARRADAMCFGTLAQRTVESRRTIQTLVAQSSDSCARVFDANLRAPFFSGDVLVESLELATVVKLNDEELPQVLSLLGLPGVEGDAKDGSRSSAELRSAQRLLEEFPALEMVALTRGSHGSLLVRRNEWHEHPGISIQVADTVGAGDAFTAALLHFLLRGAPLSTLNEAANRWGSWVASNSGAMPYLPLSVRERITSEIAEKGPEIACGTHSFTGQ